MNDHSYNPGRESRALPRPVLAFAGMALMFNIQSIDTMKDSRDLARELNANGKYEEFIDSQVSLVAEANANYVAIDVPYDEEFIPVIRRWVDSARKYGLNVWFRGNLSGWENWFGYERIGREAHLKGTENFILSHRDLFRDGDIFSACPECENGGPGDPRQTGDVEGFRNFLINEYKVHKEAFEEIGVDVRLLPAMNGDVARLIMDKETTKALGGTVVIDEYRPDIDLIEKDIVEIYESSGGKIILGEFGAPIPDINGEMTEEEQAEFVEDILFLLYKHAGKIEGANYWTLRQGSTALLNDDLTPRKVYSTIRTFYGSDVMYRAKLYLRGLLSNI